MSSTTCPKTIAGTNSYWSHQVKIWKEQLKEAETLTALHKEREEKIRAKIATAQTYLNNFNRSK